MHDRLIVHLNWIAFKGEYYLYQWLLSLFIEVAGSHYTTELGEKLAKWPLSVRLEFKRHKNVASLPFSCGRCLHSPRWNAAWPSPGTPMARSCGLRLGGSRLCTDGCLPVSSTQSISKIYLKIFVPVNDATTGLLCPCPALLCSSHWHEKWLRSLTGCAAKNIFNNLTHIFSHLWKHSLWRVCGRYFTSLSWVDVAVADEVRGICQLMVFHGKHLGISICICVLMTAVLSNAKPIFDTAPAIFNISYMRSFDVKSLQHPCEIRAHSARGTLLSSTQCHQVNKLVACSRSRDPLPEYLLAA